MLSPAPDAGAARLTAHPYMYAHTFSKLLGKIANLGEASRVAFAKKVPHLTQMAFRSR